MKVSCEEATTLCTKSQYGRLSIVDQLKLNFHLFMCKRCGKFSKQNRILTKCLDEHMKHSKNGHDKLSESEKEVMLEGIKKEL